MAKKKGPKKMPATAEPKKMRHARIELPDDVYRRLQAVAGRFQLSVSAYIRQAIIKVMETDEKSEGMR